MTDTRTESRWRDLGVRLIAALGLMPFVLFCVWWGDGAYTLLLIGAGAGIAWEWSGLVYSPGERPIQVLVHGIAVAAAIVCAAAISPWAALSVVAVCAAGSIALSLRHEPMSFWRACGVPYLTLPLLALFYLRAEAGFGFLAVVWLLFVIWATDTFAYFAGRLIGGPKLTQYSPKKTWAGLGGGAVGAALTSAVVGLYAELPVIWFPVALAVIVAVVSQIGDIFESAAKRHFNAKDTSSLIPGHGGILDRIDGLMFASLFCVGLALLRGASLEQSGRFLFW